MKKFLPLLLAFLLALPLAAQRTKVACIGNSVTFGYGLKNRATQSYPVRLQQMLGEGYEVQNFGRSSATLLRHGHLPYMQTEEFRRAMAFGGDICVVHLGLNDTDPRNWPYFSEEFIADYTALIDSCLKANPKAEIWLCRMTPIFHDHRRFDSGTRQWHAQIQQRIAQVAATNPHVKGLIDLYEPLHKRPDLFPDALHPDSAGALILAETVRGNITGQWGGLKLAPTFSSHMVLQREAPIRIHGTANAGEEVKVRFAKLAGKARAAQNGAWEVLLPAMPAGGPYTLTVEAKSGKAVLNDIFTGEVWLCSGQSNMELRLREIATAKADIAAARTEQRLHLYNMPSITPTYAFEWTPERLDSVNRLLYVLPAVWQRCATADVANFSAIAYHFGRHLADSLGCHVGLIVNAVGGATVESWTDRTLLEENIPALLRNWKTNDYVMPWARERAALNTKRSANPLQRHPYEPGYLFDCAILPLQGTQLAGVIWYQGESNAHNVELHERLFPLLENSWRRFFHAPQLPFLTVQLSSISTRPSWPSFRFSQQRLAEKLPATYLVVSSDLGDATNVHPARKAPIGRRLALQALHHVYGHAATPSEGPRVVRVEREGAKLRLLYANTFGALRPAAGAEALTGFEIAGADGLFRRATATIASATTVVLSSPEVKAPCAVRYGWQPFSEGNLENGAGLPAATYSSER